MRAYKIAVFGAGGVGGYFGALLAQAGHHVSFIARGDHLAAIRSGGLHIRGTLGDMDVVPADAHAPGEPIEDCELVLVAVKNYDLIAALPSLGALVGEKTLVVSLLNGVQAPALLGPLVSPDRLLVGQVGVGAWVQSPGLIRQEGTRRLITLAGMKQGGGDDARLQDICALFRDAGLRVTQAADAQSVMWRKLVWTAAYGGIAAVTGKNAGELRQDPALRMALHAAIAEGLTVARALKIDAPLTLADEWMATLDTLPPTAQPSLLRDRRAARQLEVDALSGAIVRAGCDLGIPTPLHALLWATLQPDGALQAQATRQTEAACSTC